ncbi:MAG TPA: alpha/beta hydrolase family protein [Thiobacillaceae bacterium]|nr:alpha/beta hydrolase family protein [Thiobacillaceae bacterium]
MRAFLLCLLVSLASIPARAAVVQIEVRPGIPASAEYLAAGTDKPAVLLLHGFLQTRTFATVATLAHGLHEAGHTVLSPTLSLGIPGRETSLACEAVHAHSLDDDVAELAGWITWLESRGHQSIVLVGHSFGSMQLLAYLARSPDPAVKGYIATSLTEAQIGDLPRAELIARLEHQIRSGDHALVTQRLSFCQNYLSTPQALLSYLRWDQARTVAALRTVPVATQLVMGDSDQHLERGWIKSLRRMRVPVAIVQGANHFMDGEHEFELLDHVLGFLQRLGGR